MKDRTSNIPIDENAARALFDRNIGVSRMIVYGDFEEALADIIRQLEDPPRTRRTLLPAPMQARRVARAINHGLLGLPPNGLDFATWVWDVAPLHFVRIPDTNELGAQYGFQAGVIHLRSIGSMIASQYCDMQQQTVLSLIPLLDSSVDWVDARCLIRHTMLRYFRENAVEEFETLQEFAREKKVWRKMVALETAADLTCSHPLQTARALTLVASALPAIGEAPVARGIVFALRCAALNGEQGAFATWISERRQDTHPEVRRVVAECAAKGAGRRETGFREAVLPVLEYWESGSSLDVTPSITRSIAGLKSAS